jgi:hypothetical protein
MASNIDTIDFLETLSIEELEKLRKDVDDALNMKKAKKELAAAENNLRRLQSEKKGIFYLLHVFVFVHHSRVFNYILFVNFVLSFMNNSFCFLYWTNCFSGLLNFFDNLAIALFSNFVNF